MGAGLVLIAYGALLALGGWAASKKQDNRIALVVGGFMGTVTAICGAIAWFGFRAGAYTGLVMTILMTLLFFRRYRVTKKIRPAGFMLVLTILVDVAVGYFIFV